MGAGCGSLHCYGTALDALVCVGSHGSPRPTHAASVVCQLFWARNMCWPRRMTAVALVFFLPLLLLSSRGATLVLLRAVGLWDVGSRRRCSRAAGESQRTGHRPVWQGRRRRDRACRAALWGARSWCSGTRSITTTGIIAQESRSDCMSDPGRRDPCCSMHALRRTPVVHRYVDMR